ncbi:MAG: carbohydrate ABC transporter substrate-binding protein, partial [Agathobacter sp.]|nr:carbohydrate ABC transporter substrate-binding protein [Agathobacter sp.]
MKKRIVAGVLALVMVLGLAGCGDQAIGGSDTTTVSNEYEEVVIDGITYKKALDMTSDKITLTYFHFDQEETINYLAERFQEIYPNITVNAVKYTGNDYGGALLSLANNDQMPDVFMTYDCDYALSNQFYADISGFWNTDEETKNLADTVNASGLGCYGTNARFAVPVKFFPGIMFVDNNVLKTLNQTAPTQQWTWSDMISLIKKCTIMGNDASDTYYGLGFYNRLDSYYGIASSQSIHGEFGFDGTDFDLSAWAVGEQEFAGLRQMGYVAPRQ